MARKRVLVVDDDPATREAVQELLTDEGFDVVSAADGQEAMALLGEISLDVILSDIRMPRVDGFGLLDYVRREHATTPFILVTGEDVAEDATRLGVADVLGKPVDFFDVIGSIHRVLR